MPASDAATTVPRPLCSPLNRHSYLRLSCCCRHPAAMSVPFFAKALFEYEAVEESELSVTAGDFLTVEEVNESGWCLVS